MLSKQKVLYVEDDIGIADEVSFFLSKRVDTLYLAVNGEDGVAKFKEFKPDLIITDIQMPKLNGLDMIKQIREQDSEIPIIVTSAFNESEMLLRAINLGVDAYLLKPISLSELIQKIEKLMRPIYLQSKLDDSNLKLVMMAKLKAKEKELSIYKERMDFVFSATNDGVWDWDIVSGANYFSPRWKEIIGYEDKELENIISSGMNTVYSDDLPSVEKALEKAFAKQSNSYEIEFRQIHKDGHLVWILSRGVVKFDKTGKPVRMIGTHTDITEKKEAQDKLIESQKSLAQAQRIAHVGSWEWDILTNKLEWSDEVFSILGETPDSFKPDFHKFLSYISEGDVKKVNENIENSLKNKNIPYDVEHEIIRKDGTQRYVHEKGDISYDSALKPISMIGTIQDITELKVAQQKLEELSVTDDLTKLYNRRHFNEVVFKELNRSKRDKNNIVFLMLDVDYFKLYNDNYGHIMGDEALVKIAQVLRDFTNRGGDYAFRLGGEEFGLLFFSETIQSAENYALSLIKSIKSLYILHEYSSVSEFVTSSAGLVFKKHDDNLNVNDLYKKADEALYEAKTCGRNQVRIKI